MRRRNAYQVLNIKNRSTDTKEIRRSYQAWKRRVAQKGAGQDEAEKRKREEEEASYKILSNEETREKYDEALSLARNQLLQKINKHCINKEGDPSSMNMTEFHELDLEQLRRIYVIYDNAQAFKLLDSIPPDAPSEKPLPHCFEENTLIQMLNAHLTPDGNGRSLSWTNPTSRVPLSQDLKIEIRNRMMIRSQELVTAVKENDVKRIQYLLENGAQAHRIFPTGNNPRHTLLTYAMYLKCPTKVLDLLVGSSPNLINMPIAESKAYPIMVAMDMKNNELFDWCIDHGARLDVKNKSGNTLLMFAVSKGTNHMLGTLLGKEETQLNVHDEKGLTSLHYASMYNNVHAVHALLDAGTHINVRSTNGNTPLHFAVSLGHVTIIDKLIQKGANMSLQNVEGQDALLLAIHRKQEKSVELLIRHDASVTKKYAEGATVLHHAVNSGDVVILKKLLDAKADPDAVDDYGNTPLLFACNFVNPNAVRLLLQAGANPNAKNHQHLSAISFIVEKANDEYAQECIDILTLYGAKITEEEKEQLQQSGITWTPPQGGKQHRNKVIRKHIK